MLSLVHKSRRMDVEDSRRTRRRILAFIAAKGGRISGGRNDGFVPWLFYELYSGAYSHERVDALKSTLLAMEVDQELLLERINEHHKGRITGARLLCTSL